MACLELYSPVYK